MSKLIELLPNIQAYIDAGLYHEIHVSEIKEFKKCKRSHKLRYWDQYYPKVTRKPLSFGTCFHAAKEIYYDPKRWNYEREISLELAKAKFVEENEKAREQTKLALGSQYSEKEETDFNDRVFLGCGMLEHYFTTVSPNIDSHIEPMYVEQKFAVAIRVTNSTPYNSLRAQYLWCDCKKCKSKIKLFESDYDLDADSIGKLRSIPVALEGKIDLIYKDKRTEKVWILDWKTAAKISQSHAWLDLDEQLNLYTWAMREIGLPIAGFAYHEDWKGFPQEPKRLNRAYGGKMYSTDKNQPTNKELFVACVQEEDPQAYFSGKYDDYIRWLELEGPQYWNREEIRKSKRELNIIGEQLRAVAQEMIKSSCGYSGIELSDKDAIPSPTKYGCMYCDFFNVCVGMQQDADWQYTLNAEFEWKQPYYADEEEHD